MTCFLVSDTRRGTCTAYLLSRGSRVRVSPGAPSSSISLNRNELEKLAVTPTPLRRKQMVGLSENGKTCHFLAFLGLFVVFYRAFVRRKLNCHEIVTPTQV